MDNSNTEPQQEKNQPINPLNLTCEHQLDDLLVEITPENIHSEIDRGAADGDEV
jgi:antitoxin component of MazEF toxin-antitoxin module